MPVKFYDTYKHKHLLKVIVLIIVLARELGVL